MIVAPSSTGRICLGWPSSVAEVPLCPTRREICSIGTRYHYWTASSPRLFTLATALAAITASATGCGPAPNQGIPQRSVPAGRTPRSGRDCPAVFSG